MLYINFYSPHLISSHLEKKIRRTFCTCWNFQKHIHCRKLLLEIFNLAEEQIASLIICCLKRNTCDIYSDIYGHKATAGIDSTPKGTWLNPKNTMAHIHHSGDVSTYLKPHLMWRDKPVHKDGGRCFTVWQRQGFFLLLRACNLFFLSCKYQAHQVWRSSTNPDLDLVNICGLSPHETKWQGHSQAQISCVCRQQTCQCRPKTQAGTAFLVSVWYVTDGLK